MIFDPPYWWWSSVLPSALCDLIILEGDKLVSGDGRIGGSSNSHGDMKPEVRDTNISFFTEGHWVEGLCIHYAMLANKNSGWNLSLEKPQNVQYARYFPDQHYTPHRDDTVRGNTQGMRKLSVAIQLSDPSDYEGGNFVLDTGHDGKLEELMQFRNRGSVLVFPSVTKHGVLPILKGVRHSLVCWVSGPNFR